jgi:hypothetical protein
MVFVYKKSNKIKSRITNNANTNTNTNSNSDATVTTCVTNIKLVRLGNFKFSKKLLQEINHSVNDNDVYYNNIIANNNNSIKKIIWSQYLITYSFVFFVNFCISLGLPFLYIIYCSSDSNLYLYIIIVSINIRYQGNLSDRSTSTFLSTCNIISATIGIIISLILPK